MAGPNNLKGPGPGRPVGAKARKKFLTTEELIALLDELGHNPMIEQVALYKDAETPASVKYKINELFLKLIFPQPKTVDHSGMIEHSHLQFGWQTTDPAPEALTVDATITPIVSTPVPEPVVVKKEDDDDPEQGK